MEPTAPLIESVQSGSFHAIPNAAFTGEGRALMVRQLDGKTDVSISLSGGLPSTDYVAHVHNAPCQYSAGTHYLIDDTILPAVSTEANELWIHATSSATGFITGSAVFNHIPRGEALAVVVHDSVGKWACADLVASEVESTISFKGTAAPFPTALGNDLTVTGSIMAARTATATAFTLSLTGLDAAATGYIAHVHNEPCATNAAATHYLADTTLPPSIDGTNEIWFNTFVVASTTAAIPVTVPYGVRTDAQSVVLHRDAVVNVPATKVKIACADLTRMTPKSPLVTTATALMLPAATGMTIAGTAVMTRKLTGVTEAGVFATGLQPNTTYAAHVHAQPCSADSGGGHYEFDKTAPAGPDNELVFSLVSDSTGTASDSAWAPHIAQADAESIILHGADGARLACFDLQ